jgi:integrase
VRLRRKGWKTTYVHAEPGTPEFTAAYRAWEKDGRISVGDERNAPGSINDLIARFYRSAEWTRIKPSTQSTYKGELERFRAKYGDRSASTMSAVHVSNLLQKMQATPSAANNLRKRLVQIFRFAILLGLRSDNPATPVRALKIRSEGHRTWQEEQIKQFEKRWPVGTRERLAFDLALYTAQRKSDVRVMGPQHVKDGKIKVRQLKTNKGLDLPIVSKLAQSIAASPTGHLAFIVSDKGAPYTSGSFGNWFRDACNEAGLEGYSMHGLRKAAARRMAEHGLSNQLIKSVTGHSSDSEVSRYTRGADQSRMAEIAMDSLANPSRA